MLLTLLSALSLGDAFGVMIALRITMPKRWDTWSNVCGGNISSPHLIAGVAWEFKWCACRLTGSDKAEVGCDDIYHSREVRHVTHLRCQFRSSDCPINSFH